MILTFTQQSEITNYINMYRIKHQVKNIVLNDNQSLFSQNWSDYLLTNNLFQHSNTQLYGENLAFFQGYGTDIITLLKLSIDAWYNEIKLYDFNNPGYSESTGHFTCLIWKSSTTFGIGISIDLVTSKAIICMNTYLPGNITGPTDIDTINTFRENVLPIKQPIPTPQPIPIPIPQPPIPIPIPQPKPQPIPIPIPQPKPQPIPIPIPQPIPIPKPQPIPIPIPIPIPQPQPQPQPIIIPYYPWYEWYQWYYNYF